MRSLLFVLLVSAFLGACSTYTPPQPGAREMSMHARNVHMAIPVAADDLAQVRLAILVAMQKAPRAKWILEAEERNAITARFDYRDATIILKAIYSTAEVRLVYVDANGGYECTDLEDGICYQAARKYFGYSKRLRQSIIRYLQSYDIAPAEEA